MSLSLTQSATCGVVQNTYLSKLAGKWPLPYTFTLGDLLDNLDLFDLRVLTLEQTLASSGCDGRCISNERVPPFFMGTWGPLCIACALANATDDHELAAQPDFREAGL